MRKSTLKSLIILVIFLPCLTAFMPLPMVLKKYKVQLLKLKIYLKDLFSNKLNQQKSIKLQAKCAFESKSEPFKSFFRLFFPFALLRIASSLSYLIIPAWKQNISFK
jgi:hypothetical protein